MGRGSGELRGMASGQLDKSNAMLDAQSGYQMGERGRADKNIGGLINDQGYSPSEKAGMTSAAVEGATSPYNSASFDVANRASASRNAAGGFSKIAALAREKGMAASGAARDVTTRFADEKERRREVGVQAQGQKYGVDTNLLSNYSRLPIEALGAYAGGISKGGWGIGPVSGSYG